MQKIVEEMDIGSILRTLRERARLTREELAGKSGLSRFGIANIERGRSSPTIRTVFKIMEITGGEMTINGIKVLQCLPSLSKTE